MDMSTIFAFVSQVVAWFMSVSPVASVCLWVVTAVLGKVIDLIVEDIYNSYKAKRKKAKKRARRGNCKKSRK